MNVTHKLEINLYNDEKYIITKDFLELFHLVYLYYFSHSKITSLKRDNLLKDINLEKYDFLYNFYC